MRISGYRVMWVFVFFDLPTETKKLRKAYQVFKKFLDKEGFVMMQFSVYVRHCVSLESAETRMKKVEKNLPQYGKVSTMMVTDKQYERINHFWCVEKSKPPEERGQIEMF